MAALWHIARLYWHTLRHLRPVQITGRVRFWLARPQPDLSAAPALATPVGPWEAPACRRPSLTGPGQFLYLNETGDLADLGWDNPAKSKLWRYNQHYFDDLNAEGAATRRDWHQDLIARWIADNAPAAGSGWEPYPTSLRIVNWVKYARSGQALTPDAIQSLAIQTRWLTRRVEWHLLGNHLFANAKALIFAAMFFEGDEADSWWHLGQSILMRELPEQFLPDGAQFELTPMYHALGLEDLLDLINILTSAGQGRRTAPLLQALRDRIPGLQHWLACLSHPDGQISFFNDAAFGIAPETADLNDYATRLGFAPGAAPMGLRHLRDSGFVRMANDQALVLADLAPVGPSYLPGHAHADSLSFELSVFGQRVFVNSGTSVYGTDAERLRQRGTRAHNTVCVAGQDSSEVWGGFRVARRAHVTGIQTETQAGLQKTQGSHDGFRRLPGGPDHHRSWHLAQTSLTVSDQLSANISAEAIYLLHPDISVTSKSDTELVLTLPGGQRLSVTSSTPFSLEPASWHPEFGLSKYTQRLILTLDAGMANLLIAWS